MTTIHDDQAHEALLSISPGYREFYADEVRDHDEMMPWDNDPDPHFMVRAFAGWLVAVGMILDDFADWPPEKFRSWQEYYNS